MLFNNKIKAINLISRNNRKKEESKQRVVVSPSQNTSMSLLYNDKNKVNISTDLILHQSSKHLQNWRMNT